jgi:hypothetical protein
MRLLIEIFIVAALISLAWEKPLRDRLPGFLTGTKPETTKAAPRLQTNASSTPSGAWMRDPNRRTVLDTPTPGHVLSGAEGSTTTHATSSPGSWMWDPNHRSPLDAPKRNPTPH